MTKCVLMHVVMCTYMSLVCMPACCNDFKLYMHPVFIHCTRTNTHTGGAFATEKDILTEFARNNESYNCILAAVVFVKPSSSSSPSSPSSHVTYKLRMAPLNSLVRSTEML